MRKSIALFGGSLFEEMRYENNSYVNLNNKTVVDLKSKYDIDNFSCKGLNSDRVLSIIENLKINEKYSTCIIALGEYEKNSSLFDYNLNKIIKYLLKFDIRPVLIGLPEKYNDIYKLDDVIADTAYQLNVDYICNGISDKESSYIVLEDNDLEKAIFELC